MPKKKARLTALTNDKEMIDLGQKLLQRHVDSLAYGERQEKEGRDSLKGCDKIVFKRENRSE